MNVPHRCPTCSGRGEIKKKRAQVGSVVVSQDPLRFRCHSCYGTGVVWDTTVSFQPFTTTWIKPDQPNSDGFTISNTLKCGSCNLPSNTPAPHNCQTPLNHTMMFFGQEG